MSQARNRRLWRQTFSENFDDVATLWSGLSCQVHPSAEEVQSLTSLLLASYKGETDDEGEDEQAAERELMMFLERDDFPAILGSSAIFFTRGEPVAACLVSRWKTNDTALISYIFVHPSWKKKSIGHSLLGTVLSRLSKSYFQHVVAVITEGNVASERLFEGSGFIPELK